MKGSSSKFCKVKCQVHTKLQSPNTPNAMQMEGPEYVYLQVFFNCLSRGLVFLFPGSLCDMNLRFVFHGN